MGNIRLNVQAGEKSELITLDTPFDDAAKDEPILSALQQVGRVKDEGWSTLVEELKAAHVQELAEKDAILAKVREPIEADIIAARMREIENLDVEKEKEYWANVPTDRLLIDAAQWVKPAEASKSKTSEEIPKTLEADDEARI